MEFAKVKSGERAGELVRYTIGRESPACMQKLLSWQKQGLSYTASGYGKKIPTSYLVRTIDQKWRRVYCTIYSNIGTTWIIQDGEKIIVDLM